MADPKLSAAVQALARVSDELLLSADGSRAIAEGYRALARVTFDGVVIRVPAAVKAGRGQVLPVLLALGQRTEETARVVPSRNLVLVVNALDDRRRWVLAVVPDNPDKNPLPDADEAAAAVGAAGPGVVQPVRSTAVWRLDLHQAQQAEWTDGRYAVRAINFDSVSNTAAMTLSGAASSSDGTVARPDRAWETRGPGTPDMLPNFLRLPASPTLAQPGIALQLPTRPVAGAGPVPVLGTVRVARPANWQARSGGAAAVMHGFFVLTRRGAIEPRLIDFAVPFYATPGPSAPESAEAHFAVDLHALQGSPLPKAGYQVYAVFDGFTAGPYPLQVD